MKRSTRAVLAQQTISICEKGEYLSENGTSVSLGESLHYCLEGTQFYQPRELAKIQADLIVSPPRQSEPLTVHVANESTLNAAQRLVRSGTYSRVGALNFASAKNPGGGFLNGSLAQEESLALCSALYPSLLQTDGFYEYHRSQRSCLYSDRMIFSPACPVFRNDRDGHLIPEPYLVSFITSPAPNAGAVRRQSPEEAELIPETLARRAEFVLALAAHHGIDALILGAWGCGVFHNDPELVAETFRELLMPPYPWRHCFKHIAFTVLDRSATGETYNAFSHLAESLSNA